MQRMEYGIDAIILRFVRIITLMTEVNLKVAVEILCAPICNKAMIVVAKIVYILTGLQKAWQHDFSSLKYVKRTRCLLTPRDKERLFCKGSVATK